MEKQKFGELFRKEVESFTGHAAAENVERKPR